MAPGSNPFDAPSTPGSAFKSGFGQGSTTVPTGPKGFGARSSSSTIANGKADSTPSAPLNPFVGSPAIAKGSFGAIAAGSGISSSPFSSVNGVTSKAFGSPSFGTSSAPQAKLGAPNRVAPTMNGFERKDAQATSRSQSPFGAKTGSLSNNQLYPNGDASKKQQAPPPLGPKNKAAKQPNGRGADVASKFASAQKKNTDRSDKDSSQRARKTERKGPHREPTERTREMSQFAYEYANKIYDHLRKENIKPPPWPADIGNPQKRAAVESLKDAYKKYRALVYESLRKADLIDDPEKRRRLEDAIPFKGICEDMCPEFEQISRIAEFDTKTEEKMSREDGSPPWNEPSIMVKKFGRSAAGQDAPLPMDVRSMDALRRTTDYLFDELLECDDNLPSMHAFLWDRTRAIRRDAVFHSQKTDEEMKDLVYVLETISRFHIVAHHLLSRKGVPPSNYDPKQETEQFGAALLSLVQAYDSCQERRIACENEPEFRSYWLLLNAFDASITSRLPAFGREFWFQSEEVQTAWSLRTCMLDLKENWGPIKPRNPLTTGGTSFSNYFEILKDPRVSYTMACLAEIHFTYVRQGVLKNLVDGYSRNGKGAPRSITPSSLNGLLQFDTEEEAADFVIQHGFEFSEWVPEGKNPVPERYLLLNDKRKYVPHPRVPPSFSAKIVERKRSGQALPYVLRNPIFEKPDGNEAGVKESQDDPESLFIAQNPSAWQENRDVDEAVAADFATANTSTPGSSMPGPVATSIGAPLVNGIHSTTTAVAPTSSVFASGGPAKAAASSSPFSNPFSSLQPPPVQPSPSTAVSTSDSPFANAKGLAGLSPAPFGGSPFALPTGPANLAKSAGSNLPFESLTKSTPAQASTVFTNGDQASSAKPSIGGLTQSNHPSNTSSGAFNNLSSCGTKQFGSLDGLKTANEREQPPLFPASSTPVATKENAVCNPTSGPEIPHATGHHDGAKPSFFSASSAFSNANSQKAGVGSPAPPPFASSLAFPGTQATSGTISFPPSTSSASQLASSSPASASNSNKRLSPGITSILGQPGTSSQVAGIGQTSLASPHAIPTNLGSAVSNTSAASGLALSTELVQFGSTSSQLAPPRNVVDNFLKWYVLGDDGILSMWMEHQVEALVQEAFNQVEQEKMEQKRKEEEEKAFRKAREFQVYNLRVKYFYRWRENARQLTTRRILREGKKKMREYYDKQRAMEKQKRMEEEKAVLDAEAVARRKAQADAYQFSQMAQLERKRRLSTEEMLLASGIFNGMRNERETARRVVNEADEVARKPFLLSGSPSPSVTSETTKKEGWKTRSLREKFVDRPKTGFRRSFSGSASVSSDLGTSRPGQRITNFTAHSRKRSADGLAKEPYAKRPAKQAAFRTKHWELRSQGFTPMPDGSWLPDSVAEAMDPGKKYDGVGDFGLGTGEPVPMSIHSDPNGAGYVSLGKALHESELVMNGPKRKREAGDEADSAPKPSSSKKAHANEPEDTESMIENTRRMIQELNETMDRVDEEDRPWMQLQMKLMERRQSGWDGHGA